MDKNNQRVYTIIGIVPKEIQNLVYNLKESFSIPFEDREIKSKFILKDIAHFAIKRSFFLKQGVTEEELINKIKSLDFEKIKITCEKSELFLGTNFGDILYVEINHNKKLIELHRSILKEIESITYTKRVEMEGEGYKPHISVVYGVSKDGLEDIKQELDTNILPFEFYLDKIILLRDIDLSKDKREIVHTFSLV